MRISILTTLTDPVRRQDKWREVINSYCAFADQVVVVNGTTKHDEVFFYLAKQPKIVQVFSTWPFEWNWVQLPEQLNKGRKFCTGDWIIKLDIDQLIHEKDYKKVYRALAECPDYCQVATFQKMSYVSNKKYYQKGAQPIAFKNSKNIVIGKNIEKRTDLCFAVKRTGQIYEAGFEIPTGTDLNEYKTGIKYWNYDYFFKTKEFTRKEFWRFSRAYNRHFKSWTFGDSEQHSFEKFISMQKARYNRAPYTYKLEDHSKFIRKSVEELTPEQFGWNGWGLL